MVAGCSGTTHSSAEFTLFKIPFGHAGKASKNKRSVMLEKHQKIKRLEQMRILIIFRIN